MARKPKARWHEGNKAWRSDVGPVGANGRRRPVYLHGIPSGPPGSAAWIQAQAAIADYLQNDQPPRLVRPARRPKPAPAPIPETEPDLDLLELDPVLLEAVADDPSPEEIAAAMVPMRALRQRGMRDGRAEIDQPGRCCTAPASGRSTSPAEPDAATVCRRLLREHRRRTRRNRDLAALPALPCPDVATA